MKKENVRKIANLLLLVIVFAITLWSVFGGEDLKELRSYLQSADFLYLFPAVLCVIFFIIGEAVVIVFLMRSLGTQVRFSHCCLYSFIGFFYSSITPSASGGQPMQVVAMRTDGIPVAVSTVVLAIVTILYKLVLVVIGVGVMVIRPPVIMAYLDHVDPLIYLGVALNVGCIILLLMLVFHPGFIQACAQKAQIWITRIRPMKHPEKLQRRLENMTSQYTGTADYYRTHKRVIFVVFVLTLLQRFLLFLVTWFSYRAFGLQGERIMNIVLLQAMISVAVDMLPLPGGMGVSENLFLRIFLPVFGSELVLPGMVISRGISYYTQLLISAVMTLAASFIIRRKGKKEAH